MNLPDLTSHYVSELEELVVEDEAAFQRQKNMPLNRGWMNAIVHSVRKGSSINEEEDDTLGCRT